MLHRLSLVVGVLAATQRLGLIAPGLSTGQTEAPEGRLSKIQMATPAVFMHGEIGDTAMTVRGPVHLREDALVPCNSSLRTLTHRARLAACQEHPRLLQCLRPALICNKDSAEQLLQHHQNVQAFARGQPSHGGCHLRARILRVQRVHSSLHPIPIMPQCLPASFCRSAGAST